VADTNLESALAATVSKLASRKFGVAVVAMWFLQSMGAPTWQVFGVAVAALSSQLVLDLCERLKLGKDLPDNGNGEAVKPEQAVT